jgi:hypothetical protein
MPRCPPARLSRNGRKGVVAPAGADGIPPPGKGLRSASVLDPKASIPAFALFELEDPERGVSNGRLEVELESGVDP